MIVVSDRGPRSLTDDGRVIDRGGSVTRLLARQLARAGEPATWVAPTTDRLDRWPGRIEDLSRCPGAPSARYVPVQVPAEEYDGYYLKAGARVLWMALHALEVRAADEADGERAYADYAAVNAAVTDAVVARARVDEPVLVQDYQLALVPGMLRERGFRGPVSFFLHTAFDAASFARAGDRWARGWLTSLCAADVLWFQADRWRAEFAAAARRVLAAEPPPSRVRPVTLGRADAAALRELVPGAEPPGLGWDPGRVNLVFVGRLDPAKNIERCVLAYESLLRERPSLAGTARLTLFLVPSRPSLPEYAEYAGRVMDRCERVRRDFPGSLTVVPGDDQGRALWAVTRADVVVACSVRDGGNLVVQEAAWLSERGCRLVVGSGLGVTDLLGDDAYVVTDPHSVRETRAALAAAIDAPPVPEPSRRRDVLERCRPGTWLAAQLDGCRAAVTVRSGDR